MQYFPDYESVPKFLTRKIRKSYFPPSAEEKEWMHLGTYTDFNIIIILRTIFRAFSFLSFSISCLIFPFLSYFLISLLYSFRALSPLCATWRRHRRVLRSYFQKNWKGMYVHVSTFCTYTSGKFLYSSGSNFKHCYLIIRQLVGTKMWGLRIIYWSHLPRGHVWHVCSELQKQYTTKKNLLTFFSDLFTIYSYIYFYFYFYFCFYFCFYRLLLLLLLKKSKRKQWKK